MCNSTECPATCEDRGLKREVSFGGPINEERAATFSGRASRSEFWWFFLFQALALFIVANWNEKIVTVVILALLVPSLAVGARRLHDMGKSGWWQLLWLIPVVGWAVLIYWAAQPGKAPNRFTQ